MSDRLNVLYDHPGPKARRRNAILSVVVVALLALLLWWIYDTLDGKNQLTAERWKPFLTSEMWTTYLLPGLLETLKAAALSVLISIPVGALLGVARMSDHGWVRWIAGIVVEFFRAIPVLILMVFAAAFYALYTGLSAGARPLVAVVTALVLYNGSVLAEVFRAGILSLPKGQTEAAVAIGMRKTQVMTQILLPQALTVMLPAVISQLVVIVKDTALGGILLSFAELRRSAGTAASVYGNFLAVYVVVAAIYIALNLLLSYGAGYVEKRMRVRRGGGSPAAGLEPVTGVGEAGVPAALVPDGRGI